MLTDKQRTALLVELHRSIEGAATEFVASLHGGDEPGVTYPPNGELTGEEVAALQGVPQDVATTSGLRKLAADAAAKPLWTLFALLDGVGDPEVHDEELGPLELVASEDGENFHETWLDEYWTWRKLRPDPGWKLDTYEGEDEADE